MDVCYKGCNIVNLTCYFVFAAGEVVGIQLCEV